MDCDDLQVHVSGIMAINPFYIFFSTTLANSFCMKIDEWVWRLVWQCMREAFKDGIKFQKLETQIKF